MKKKRFFFLCLFFGWALYFNGLDTNALYATSNMSVEQKIENDPLLESMITNEELEEVPGMPSFAWFVYRNGGMKDIAWKWTRQDFYYYFEIYGDTSGPLLEEFISLMAKKGFQVYKVAYPLTPAVIFYNSQYGMEIALYSNHWQVAVMDYDEKAVNSLVKKNEYAQKMLNEAVLTEYNNIPSLLYYLNGHLEGLEMEQPPEAGGNFSFRFKVLPGAEMLAAYTEAMVKAGFQYYHTHSHDTPIYYYYTDDFYTKITRTDDYDGWWTFYAYSEPFDPAPIIAADEILQRLLDQPVMDGYPSVPSFLYFAREGLISYSVTQSVEEGTVSGYKINVLAQEQYYPAYIAAMEAAGFICRYEDNILLYNEEALVTVTGSGPRREITVSPYNHSMVERLLEKDAYLLSLTDALYLKDFPGIPNIPFLEKEKITDTKLIKFQKGYSPYVSYQVNFEDGAVIDNYISLLMETGFQLYSFIESPRYFIYNNDFCITLQRYKTSAVVTIGLLDKEVLEGAVAKDIYKASLEQNAVLADFPEVLSPLVFKSRHRISAFYLMQIPNKTNRQLTLSWSENPYDNSASSFIQEYIQALTAAGFSNIEYGYAYQSRYITLYKDTVMVLIDDGAYGRGTMQIRPVDWSFIEQEKKATELYTAFQWPRVLYVSSAGLLLPFPAVTYINRQDGGFQVQIIYYPSRGLYDFNWTLEGLIKAYEKEEVRFQAMIESILAEKNILWEEPISGFFAVSDRADLMNFQDVAHWQYCPEFLWQKVDILQEAEAKFSNQGEK